MHPQKFLFPLGVVVLRCFFSPFIAINFDQQICQFAPLHNTLADAVEEAQRSFPLFEILASHAKRRTHTNASSLDHPTSAEAVHVRSNLLSRSTVYTHIHRQTVGAASTAPQQNYSPEQLIVPYLSKQCELLEKLTLRFLIRHLALTCGISEE